MHKFKCLLEYLNYLTSSSRSFVKEFELFVDMLEANG